MTTDAQLPPLPKPAMPRRYNEDGYPISSSTYTAEQVREAQRAAIEAYRTSRQGEAVAEVCDTYELRWVASGPIAPIVHRHGIKVGTLLYTHPADATQAEQAARYRKLQGWMSSNVPEGWSEVKKLGAVAAWVSHEAMDQTLDALPECNVGLMERAATLTKDQP